MRLVFALALVASFVGHGYCQLDCALPEASDIKSAMADSILNGDNASPPTITITRFEILCLALSEERGRYRGYSVLVEYTCNGYVDCPTGIAVEQFEGECESDNGTWSGSVSAGTSFTRTQSPTAEFDVTVRREDCSVCFSPEKGDDENVPPSFTIDPDTHCVGCLGCDDGRPCFGTSADECCNVFIENMCAINCTGGDVLDETTFECLNVCPNDRGDVVNGEVDYSNMEETDGGYRAGTVATVTCVPRYAGGGTVICESSGNWSAILPTCEEATCDEPPAVDNAALTNTMATWPIGSTATYECITNYFFSEDSEMSIVCTDQRVWPGTDNIKCVECGDVIPGCKECGIDEDGKVVCVDCEEDFRMSDNKCEEITGGRDEGLCIPCIVVPIAVLLAIIAAIIVAAIVYAFYKWKRPPPTDLSKKDPEGINGIARDNPLYVDPDAVADEVE